MEPRQALRHELYDWLVKEGFDLTDERRRYVAEKIQYAAKLQAEHSDKRGKQAAHAAWKIEQYLTKAKALPETPTIKVQVATLKLVSGWLNQAPE